MAGSRQRRGRLEFNRPPRLRSVLSTAEVHIPSPPQAAFGRSGSIVSPLLIALAATLATSSVFILFALANPGGNQSLLLIMGVVLVISAVPPTSAAFIQEQVGDDLAVVAGAA